MYLWAAVAVALVLFLFSAAIADRTEAWDCDPCSVAAEISGRAFYLFGPLFLFLLLLAVGLQIGRRR